ncbi:mannose-1-phosphate guanylyltransferase/mannose-6-phosphate isomerase [Ferrovibrio sp.]|uniref:mannose-1-phosphate guanylyltransferase/mannose-6-phosphate isomerase n=1 Tax=Ferrovibrio sp. TaxID=1917215 RepID=UPI0025BF2007|nr:mannose-1-phosphate guanylyltransferase/mannose-6-phosphate isomerase [Ferrovibrio sp.]MBX3453784.1 mannose-1-phosphate guanylyltransferase/mannose-6-phosphate isomerase [Ferrovibrio sp.]
MAIRPVILSGGAGTRLWPLSRELYPKQLHALAGDRTLLQQTAQRLQAEGFGQPLVICNEQHRFIVAEQLREAGIEPLSVVVEPVGRNTAPAVAVAASLAAPDDLLLLLPSDHLVRKPDAFLQAVRNAAPLAQAGHLVTFGIQPTAPETGYGYIQRGPALGDAGYQVARFAEKPDAATAARYIAGGDFFWNAGILLFRADAMLAELQAHCPDLLAGTQQALSAGARDLFFFRLDNAAFSAIRGESIDYAVMERTQRAAVMPVDMGWSDIGGWPALWAESNPDQDGNVLQGDVLALDSQGSYLRADGLLLAAIGLKDVVVVAGRDAVLVADKARASDVKQVVDRLKAQGRREATEPMRVYRPWGWYEDLAEGPRHRVKRLCLHPGGKISLQKHAQRSEHWVVVRGEARVTRGEDTFTLLVNQSTYIAAGLVHRLENAGTLPLEIIEVQSGDYVGEDDIVRLDDIYGR